MLGNLQFHLDLQGSILADLLFFFLASRWKEYVGALERCERWDKRCFDAVERKESVYVPATPLGQLVLLVLVFC